MGSSITLKRRVGWIDTDAAGIWHHSTALRWMEEAETELHRELGIVSQTFGSTPRVHTEFDFRRPLHFDDEVDVTMTVDDIGESSISYAFDVSKDDDTVATGRMVAVLIEPHTGAARAWPAHMRQALLGN